MGHFSCFLTVLQGCVDHRTFVRFIPGSRRRLQHSTFTFHIMPSNNQLTYHHAHKLTRTFVWIAFFVCTEFDRDINSSSYYSRQTCRTPLTMSIFVTTRRQFSWLEKCTRHLSSKLRLCPTCMYTAYLDSCSVQRYITPIQPISSIKFSSHDQTIFGQFSLQILSATILTVYKLHLDEYTSVANDIRTIAQHITSGLSPSATTALHAHTHSLTHCHTRSLFFTIIYCHTHSLTHSPSHLLTHCHNYSMSHSLTHTLTH
jgi:hypothetical protein